MTRLDLPTSPPPQAALAVPLPRRSPAGVEGERWVSAFSQKRKSHKLKMGREDADQAGFAGLHLLFMNTGTGVRQLDLKHVLARIKL